MTRAGVIGHPIGHSLSPAIHRFWLDRFGTEGKYERFDPGPDEEAFRALVADLRAQGFAGINVTMPFKRAALALADRAGDSALRVGGANTLTFDAEGGAEGVSAASTDALGFAAALRALAPGARRALVLGAGGTAPSVLDALSGLDHVAVANRTDAKAEALAARVGRTPVPWNDREDTAASADLVVNATPLGLRDTDPLPLSVAALGPEARIADCVYAPGGTPLVRAAAARGIAAMDGFYMLVAQAAPGHEAWFGNPIDEALIAETAKALRP